jgi:glyoxylase-like metal-dependent hydrolase (beta-lactamase superfamily II)
MSGSRRDFIKSSSLLLGAILYPVMDLLSFTKLFPLSGIRGIRPNIGVFTSQGGTIGWFVSEDALVVIDTQFPDSAKGFMDEIHKKTKRRIDILFNTHHHSDHTSGNYFLKDFADKIVAQENCPLLQRKFYGNGENEKQQVYADTTFKTECEYSIGTEKLSAYHFGSAHTAADAFIHFQNSNVVHIGDLVFNKIYPYMDRPAGCFIEGSIKVLERVASLFDKDTIFIFGHAGSDENVTGSVDDVVAMKNYFSALLEFVNKGMKAGKSLEQIKSATHIPGFEFLTEQWKGAKDMSITAAYEELSS